MIQVPIAVAVLVMLSLMAHAIGLAHFRARPYPGAWAPPAVVALTMLVALIFLPAVGGA